jgi:hypothetical protein
MQGLTVTIRRCGSSTAAAVIGWRGRYTSNSGHEGEQSARPFRANSDQSAAQNKTAIRSPGQRAPRTLRTTPAMAAGISDRLWSLEELVEQTS